MKRDKHRDRRHGRQEQPEPQGALQPPDPRFIEREPRVTRLEPKNEIQARYIHSIERNILTIATGPAGTGKTYCCGVLAALALKDKAVRKIIVTRPAVEAGENLGFLPGEKEEKYEPYIVPFRDVLTEVLGRGALEYFLKTGDIEPAPLAYMRGRTFKNCFVILDEAQNVTPVQMKMFLTRIGENCTVIVNGDLRQKDIPGPSGLEDAIRRLGRVRRVEHIEFEAEDIVRSGFVQDVVDAYDA
jgi:phosphate starvation-inducible PhoH-like protein